MLEAMTDLNIITPTIQAVLKTNEQIAKEKKAEYMRNYMKEYNKKRMETDEAYREYRRQMSRANNKKMYQKYVKALNYTKENNINV
jgi:hypothetical protein